MLTKLTQEEIDTLSVFLFDELNNLVQGWTLGRSCEAHNLITFCVWYCMCTPDSVEDIISVDNKKAIHDVLDKYRYPRDEDEDNSYLWWHNQSRDITDHTDRYLNKPANVFLKAIADHFWKVGNLYGRE